MFLLRNVRLKDYTSMPVVWMLLILLLGFVIGAGNVNELDLRSGNADIAGSSKALRAMTVVIVFIIAVFIMFSTSTMKYLLKGTNGYLFVFALLCLMSTVFSPVKSLTLYKSFEIFTVVLVLTVFYASKDRYETSRNIIFALFFFYTITVIGVYAQFAIFGSEGQRQLVGATPLFGFMMISKYPGMVGNALGYLGAVVALFGIYLVSANDNKSQNRRMLGIIVFTLGAGVTFLSYTRSIMVFLFIAVFLFAAYRKKYALNFFMIFIIIAALGVPAVRDKVMEHMRRGSTDEQVTTLSGRTEMWAQVFSQNLIDLMVGGGYATGSKFMHYEKTHTTIQQGNVHNGLLEVAMSVGLVGAAIWLAILIRICVQFYTFFKRTRSRLNAYDRNFHVFMIALLLLSVLRSVMNSTFVYLDYFYPILMVFIMYGDSLRYKMANISVSPGTTKHVPTSEPLIGKRSGILAHRKTKV